MKRSLNEIEQTCRKAARGSGLPWGVADDTGRAVRWLHGFGLDGVSSLVALLERLDHQRAVDYAPQSLDGVWQGACHVLSPIMTGLALSDCMSLLPERGIRTREIACPLLVAGYVGQTLLRPEQSVRLLWLSIRLTIGHDRLAIIGDQGDLYTDSAPHLICDKGVFEQPGRDICYPKVGDMSVSAGAWGKLESRAWLTYVEATEESRLSGAGAGLNDND